MYFTFVFVKKKKRSGFAQIDVQKLMLTDGCYADMIYHLPGIARSLGSSYKCDILNLQGL